MKVTMVSEERSRIAWWETGEQVKKAHVLQDEPVPEPEAKVEAFTPEEMMKKLDKKTKVSKKKRRK